MAIVDGLITLADAHTQLGIPSTMTANDPDLELYVMAATPIIELRAGPILQKTRTFTFDGGGTSVLVPKLVSVTSVQVYGADFPYVANLSSGIIYAGNNNAPLAFVPGIQNVVVVAVVGTGVVPYNAQLATRELVRHWWQQGRQANRPGTADEVVMQPLPLGVSNRIDELLAPTPNVPGFA